MASNTMSARGVGSPVAVVHCRRLNETPTMSSGQAWFTEALDPFNPVVYTPAVNGLAGAYEFYRIRSASVTLVPSGGTLNSGSLRCCFLINPEIITSAFSSNTSFKSTALYNEQGCTILPFSVGGVKRLDINRVHSRKWYSCNFTTPHSNPEVVDRSTQCVFHGEFIKPDAGTNTNCTLIFDTVIEFSGLGRSSALTLVKAVGVYTVPYIPEQGEDSEDFPKEVALVTRTGKRSLYIKPTEPKPTGSHQ